MSSAESPTPLEALESAVQAGYITVVQHVRYMEIPSHPGILGLADWRYGVLTGMVSVQPQEDPPSGHSTTYSFVAPNAAKVVLRHALDDTPKDDRQELIIVNVDGVASTYANTWRRRRTLKKSGIEILPLVTPRPWRCELAEAI